MAEKAALKARHEFLTQTRARNQSTPEYTEIFVKLRGAWDRKIDLRFRERQSSDALYHAMNLPSRGPIYLLEEAERFVGNPNDQDTEQKELVKSLASTLKGILKEKTRVRKATRRLKRTRVWCIERQLRHELHKLEAQIKGDEWDSDDSESAWSSS